MSRTIRTIDGQEIVGLKGSFRDEGDHLVKKGPFGSETRIRKDLIVHDSSRSTPLEVGVAIAAVGVFVAAAIAAEGDSKKRW